MINIELSQLHEYSEEGRGDVYHIDASELGLPPGNVPKMIEAPKSLGNVMPFLLAAADQNMFKYVQELGILRLYVYND